MFSTLWPCSWISLTAENILLLEFQNNSLQSFVYKTQWVTLANHFKKECVRIGLKSKCILPPRKFSLVRLWSECRVDLACEHWTCFRSSYSRHKNSYRTWDPKFSLLDLKHSSFILMQNIIQRTLFAEGLSRHSKNLFVKHFPHFHHLII